MDTITLIFTLFSCFWAFVALLGFSLWLLNRWLWERAKRDRWLNRYRFDNLGNPEFYFNPKTGVDYLPLPGNKAFPEQTVYQANTPRPATRREPQIYVESIPLEQYAALQNTSKELTSPRSELSNEEVLGLLQEGIEQGLSKTQTLLQKLGVKGGPDFTKLGKIYDKLAGKEEQMQEPITLSTWEKLLLEKKEEERCKRRQAIKGQSVPKVILLEVYDNGHWKLMQAEQLSLFSQNTQ